MIKLNALIFTFCALVTRSISLKPPDPTPKALVATFMLANLNLVKAYEWALSDICSVVEADSNLAPATPDKDIITGLMFKSYYSTLSTSTFPDGLS